MRHSSKQDTTACSTATMAASSALHRFFASSFPLPILQGNDVATVCRVVEDNAKGLVTHSSASERRRLKDARRIKIQQLCKSRSRPGVPRSSSTKLSRWESEVPDLASLTASPPAPTRRRSLESVDPTQEAVVPYGICAPKIPRRRTSRSEGSKGGPGKQGQAPVVPQQLSTSLPSLLKTNNVEANTSPGTIEDYVPQERIRPVAQSSQARSTVSKKPAGRVSPLPESLDTFLNRKSSLKNAPRRPRRMKSMELVADDGDTMSISVSDEDDSFRYSVQPLFGRQQQDTNPVKLPPVEQIALKDAIKGVVVSLAQQQKVSRRSSLTNSNYRQGKPMEMNSMLNL